MLCCSIINVHYIDTGAPRASTESRRLEEKSTDSEHADGLSDQSTDAADGAAEFRPVGTPSYVDGGPLLNYRRTGKA